MKYKYYLVVLFILVVDQVTKWIANASLHPRQAIDIIPGYLRLSRVYNSGVAFGLFDNADFPHEPLCSGPGFGHLRTKHQPGNKHKKPGNQNNRWQQNLQRQPHIRTGILEHH